MDKIQLGFWCQEKAVNIEHITWTIFDLENFDGSDLFSSDFIRENPFTTMISTLTAVYNHKSSVEKENINKFIDRNSFCLKLSIDDIVSKYDKETFESIYTEWEKLL